jgi:hypothetical protein
LWEKELPRRWLTVWTFIAKTRNAPLVLEMVSTWRLASRFEIFDFEPAHPVRCNAHVVFTLHVPVE